MKQIPNILSAVRIALSFLLLALTKDTALFLIVYLIIGISDILDGWLARSLHVQSELGAHLDSIGDQKSSVDSGCPGYRLFLLSYL